jgi:hypothetical protein
MSNKKCHYCEKPATSVKTTEIRTGAGIVIDKTYSCKIHAGLGHTPDVNIGVLRFQEYGLANPTGYDPS